jgi:hypothetical protein
MRTAFRALLTTFFGHRRQVGVFFFSTLLIVSVFFLAPAVARAEDTPLVNSIGEQLGLLVGNLFLFFTEILGKLLLFVMDTFLVPVAGYNGFVTELVVQQGWVIVRDLTNMFFVLMMLVISIGTILGIEEFSYRRLLPRLLVMAVLINFSKVIVGLMIDFSQVVMLTFVNGFSAAAGGNMIQLLRLEKTMDISEGLPTQKLDIWDFIGAQFLGLLMIIISLMIIVVMCMMLAFRIVMLWILTILSPLVFFLSTVQKGKAQQAYAQWWDKLGTYLVSGPVLAFFLWLALSVSAAGGLTKDFDTSGEVSEVGNAQQYFVSSAGSRDSLVGYIIGVAMLLGGMYITADFGAMGGSMLRSGADFFSKTAPRAIGRLAYGGTIGAGIGLAGAGLARASTAAEQKWFENTGRYLPFSKRKEEYKKGLAARREQDAANTGLRKRYQRAQKPVLQAQNAAAEMRTTAVQATEARNALLANVRQARGRATDIENATGQDTFIMDNNRRRALDSFRTIFEQQALAAQQAGDAAAEQLANDQLGGLDDMLSQNNGAQVSWNTLGYQGVRATLQNRAQQLNAQAAAEEEAVLATPAYQTAESARAAAVQRADVSAQNAREARLKFAGDPDTKFTSAAIAKANAEAREGIARMSMAERQNALRDAWDRRDKFRFKAIFEEMGNQEEADDVLGTDMLGQRFGTNGAGMRSFREAVGERFGVSDQESLQIVKPGFDAAAAKGQHMFRGAIVTDLVSNALRESTPLDADIAQARRIDGMEIEDFWKKDQTAGVVTINADGTTSLIEAMVSKLGTTQDKFLEMLSANRVHQKMLQALKDNIGQLQQAQQQNVLSQDTIDRIVSATAVGAASAEESIRRRANA